MSQCCKAATPPDVVLVDQLSAVDQHPNLPPSGIPLCSYPSLPSSSSDIKAILIELRNESAAAAIRQEKFFAEILKEIATLRSEQDATCAELKGVPSAKFDVHRSSELQTAGNGASEAANGQAKNMTHNTALVAGDNPPSPMSPTKSDSSKKSKPKSFSFQEEKTEIDITGVGRKRAIIRQALTSKEFEMAIAFFILSNALVMFWEGQYQGLDVGFRLLYPGRPTEAHDVWANAERAFDIADWFFGLLFGAEALFKLCFWGLYYLKSKWNLLDLLCVLTFAFDKAATVSLGFNPQTLRLLRLFRLVRLVRLLRFLENLDHLYVMTMTISGLGKVLAWASVLLTCLLLACNLLITQVLQATYFADLQASDLTEYQLQRHHKMYEYFGTCSRSMLSMFEITLGNWPPVARLLSEEVSQWFTLFCVLHKLSIGFAVISVINGVILQETFKVAQTDDVIMLRQKKRASAVMRAKMEALFEALDSDGDGALEKEEFEAMSHDPNIVMWLASLDIETDDLGTLFYLCDQDSNGRITLDEIISRMPRIRGPARSIDLLNLKAKMRDSLGVKRRSRW